MGWALLGFILLMAVLVIGIYNRLVTGRNRYRNAFAQIDVQLTRRYDLIPNLVAVAEGYMTHERETLGAVVAARNQAAVSLRQVSADPGNGAALARLEQAERGLASAMGQLFAVAEAYPDLKANQTMMQLSEELVSTENRVAFARQAFNDAVMSYNTQREIFPNNLIAGQFGFTAAKLLKIAEPSQRAAVEVAFRDPPVPDPPVPRPGARI